MNWGTRFTASLLVALATWIGFNHAHAMGLGEARVNSFLNQTLDVQVRLLEISEANLDSLTVRIGDASSYEQLGLMTDVLALGVSISIDRSQRPAILRITSQRAATDPVVQLLVDARWSSGRILREYTLFLDPPTITAAPPPVNVQPSTPARVVAEPVIGSAPEPAATATTSEPISEPISDPVAQPIADPAVEATQSITPQAVRSDGSSLIVMPGDTLWSLAIEARPDIQLSMDQTMLAIVELNPSAFRNGSVHQLFSGVELQLPDESQVASIDPQLARQTIEMQNRAFNQNRENPVALVADSAPVRLEPEQPEVAEPSVSETPASAGELTAGSEAESAAAEIDEFRLELVPPAEGDEGLGLAADQREADQLSQQLARTEEELFTAQLEAEDFQARLTELESMVNDNPGGLGIQDFDLAQLEQTLREAREASAADPLTGGLGTDLSQQVDRLLEQFAQAPSDDPMAEAQAEIAADAEPEQLPAGPVVTQVGEPRSGLFGNPLLWGFGLLGILIGVGLLFFVLKHIRESDQEPVERVRAQTPPAPDPLLAAESRVQSKPDDLNAHLSLLKALDGTKQPSRFSAALSSMYARVDDDDEPLWLEALALAANTVPDHPLVQGSLDWVAGGDSEIDAGNNEGDIDSDEQFEDLMALMDEDMDSTDDQSSDKGPTIESSGNQSNEFEANELDESEVPDETNSDPISYDWPEAGEGDALAEQDANDDTSDSSNQAEDTDTADIFGATDDDIDVKLDLARAYLSWNSIDSAKTLLEEVLTEGNERHQEQAKKLLDGL